MVVLSIVIISSTFIFIYFSIVTPLKRLDSSILSFDPSSGNYKEPNRKAFIFKDTFKALEKLSIYIQKSNIKLEELNEEVYLKSIVDSLTNIPNRKRTNEVVYERVKNEKPFSLIFIDLDNFKNVNDTLGNVIGDLILKEIAKRLKSALKDQHFIGRYGSDEFIVLVESIDEKIVNEVIKKMYNKFNKPVNIKGNIHTVSFSVGISSYPTDGINSTELIRKADVGVREAKKRGNNKISYCDENLDHQLKNEAEIRELLTKAVKEDGIKIVLQPQIDLKTETIISYEALARLNNNEYGPAQFIPVAEKYGLIYDITSTVFKKAIEALVLMRENNLELKTIFINYSPSQFWNVDIIDRAKDHMDMFNIDPKYIGLEITEKILVEECSQTIKFFNKVKKYNIKIAIDDFGSGHAGLNYLSSYELDLVKLDKSFQAMFLNEEKLDVYKTIIDLAVKLGYEVLAEGIEKEEEVSLLRKTKCKYVQGFYYYKPQDVKEIIEINKKLLK